jgi:2'-5' RNA ligase
MRIFVAIVPAADETERLYVAARELRQASFPIRWMPPENIHLTLKFLGELSGDRIADLGDALGQALADVRAFEIRLDGFGAFPSPRRPSVVWAGVESNPHLEDVYERVEGALAELGHPRETREFHPHLTLGRARKGNGPRQFRGLAELLGTLSWTDTFGVGAVDVVRSEPKPTGAEYDTLRRLELRR